MLETTRAAFTDGMHLAAVVGLVCMIAGSATAYRLMKHLPVAGARRSEAPEEARAGADAETVEVAAAA